MKFARKPSYGRETRMRSRLPAKRSVFLEDLNHLLHREQTSLLHAQTSLCANERAVHQEHAADFAARIVSHRLPYRSRRADGSTAFAPSRFRG